jgi:hypothetical protein
MDCRGAGWPKSRTTHGRSRTIFTMAAFGCSQQHDRRAQSVKSVHESPVMLGNYQLVRPTGATWPAFRHQRGGTPLSPLSTLD